MKKKNSNNKIKASIAIIIALTLLMSVNIASSDDTEPPIISDIYVTTIAEPDEEINFFCMVTDNEEVVDVRLNVTGPDGFELNDTMIDYGYNYYGYNIYGPHVIGQYGYYIWAIDANGNSVTSEPGIYLVLEPMDIVYVDDSNIGGPWNGTYEHPLQFIYQGITVVNPGGIVIVNEGIYQENIIIDKQLSLYGSGQEITEIIGQGDEDYIISIAHDDVEIIGFSIGGSGNRGILINQYVFNIFISNCLIHNNVGDGIYKLEAPSQSTYCDIIDCDFHNNGNCGIQFYGCLENSVIDCDFINCTVGLRLGSSSDNNFINHNNFAYNIHNAIDNGNNNLWDDGNYGNYWDDYRDLYPYAEIDIINGTWETPYDIDNSQDMHPWVYPNGYIDFQNPFVELLYPNGGEIVNGEIILQWNAYDDHTSNLDGTIRIEYSSDNGASWIELSSGLNNTGGYTWDTETVENGDEYLIKISAIDEFENIGYDESDSAFTVFNNNPPDTPDTPSGPTNGEINIQYGFSISIPNDPEEDEIYIKWDWGDGEISDWKGPYNSGEYLTTLYSWDNPGVYDIKVKAKDVHDEESDWSESLEITITEPQPAIEIGNITGGWIGILKGGKVSAEIKNTGDTDALNVTAIMDVSGGFLGLINKTNALHWGDLSPGGKFDIPINQVFGFGPIEIVVTAKADGIEDINKTTEGFIFFSYVFIGEK